MKKLILLFFAFSLTAVSIAQKSDSIGYAGRKNTIRWNLTPMLILSGKSFVLGYERIVSSHQSFSINVGYLQLSPFKDKDKNPIQLLEQESRGGFDIAVDYRFYFKKRNKRIAPDGLYWGPYSAYYYLFYKGKGSIFEDDVVVNTLTFDGNFQMISTGVQLGYQFVFWERLSVDLILMGPSFTYYKIDLGMQTEFALSPEYYEDLKELFGDLPILKELIENQRFSSSGKVDFGHIGFRYGIQIGYRF